MAGRYQNRKGVHVCTIWLYGGLSSEISGTRQHGSCLWFNEGYQGCWRFTAVYRVVTFIDCLYAGEPNIDAADRRVGSIPVCVRLPAVEHDRPSCQVIDPPLDSSYSTPAADKKLPHGPMKPHTWSSVAHIRGIQKCARKKNKKQFNNSVRWLRVCEKRADLHSQEK